MILWAINATLGEEEPLAQVYLSTSACCHFGAAQVDVCVLLGWLNGYFYYSNILRGMREVWRGKPQEQI